ncbi:uncharacterized protein NECHADRAFT_82592 [Fusarium vanettenii 77-13-4]|uniref:BZIP domain-containing protein n=1 Tax=Fusarium vanettenii (strain ATCC MYA-4622 / CBS 123669 / FGSC 9596 / NRRL 45880 / 77-13-4) TaxID=660122 RepID=C7YXN5_FUSV7|nr:uncharacterized protein NECHADRAFT_82592 [Fusarium vanettenii 77-13-4]EEU43620.1 hypothetical protein NECHADRAFT_82592 [Fusarium vanettenii 77-13-4]
MTNDQVPRRGRPRVEGRDRVNDQVEIRRTRMRLAQRTYRARKESAFNQERTRNQQLSQALDRALATFTVFHQHALGLPEVRGSSDLIASLNQAASEMATIASDTNKSVRLLFSSEAFDSETQRQQPGNISLTDEGAGDLQTQMLSKTVALTIRSADLILGTLSEKLFRACLERVFTILAGNSGPKGRVLDLRLPLDILGEELLRSESLNILALPVVMDDYRYLPHSMPHLPLLYRVVEGSQDIIPRLPAPSVQRIVRGRTRTRLATAFEPLQGEWLEAMDVEEYLEDRGIFLRGADLSHEINNQSSAPSVQHSAEINYQQQQLPEVEDPSGEGHHHEDGDYSVFGVPTTQEWIGSAELLPPLGTGLQSIEELRAPWTDTPQQNSQVASQIIIDIDKLVQLLASSATCLGPVPGIRRTAVDSSIAQSVIQLSG